MPAAFLSSHAQLVVLFCFVCHCPLFLLSPCLGLILSCTFHSFSVPVLAPCLTTCFLWFFQFLWPLVFPFVFDFWDFLTLSHSAFSHIPHFFCFSLQGPILNVAFPCSTLILHPSPLSLSLWAVPEVIRALQFLPLVFPCPATICFSSQGGRKLFCLFWLFLSGAFQVSLCLPPRDGGSWWEQPF